MAEGKGEKFGEGTRDKSTEGGKAVAIPLA